MLGRIRNLFSSPSSSSSSSMSTSTSPNGSTTGEDKRRDSTSSEDDENDWDMEDTEGSEEFDDNDESGDVNCGNDVDADDMGEEEDDGDGDEEVSDQVHLHHNRKGITISEPNLRAHIRKTSQLKGGDGISGVFLRDKHGQRKYLHSKTSVSLRTELIFLP